MLLLALLLILPCCHAFEMPDGVYQKRHYHAIDSETKNLANAWLAEVSTLSLNLVQLSQDNVVQVMRDGSNIDLAADVNPLALLSAQMPAYSIIIIPERMTDHYASILTFLSADPTAVKLSTSFNNVPLSAHVYVSGPGRARALHPHTDGGDVFVYQLTGRKDWTICTPPCPVGYACDNLTSAEQALMADVAKKHFNGNSLFGCSVPCVEFQTLSDHLCATRHTM